MSHKKIMKNLRNEMYKVINNNNYTFYQYAIICDIFYKNLYMILSGKAKDIKMSTFLKICNNSGISFKNIFELHNFNFKENIHVIIDGSDYWFKCIK